jgi:vitamin B12 transporter
VRGPQSALYGSDAISSVIQLFTPRGYGAPQGFLRFRGGNDDTFEEQTGFSGGTDVYGYYLAVERVDTNGTQPINSDYSNTSLASRFDLDPFDNLQIMLPIRYHDSRAHFPTGGAGDRFERKNGTLDANQYGDRSQVQLGPRVRYNPTSWWRHTLQLGYMQEWRTFRDPFDANADFGSFVSNTSERRFTLDYASDFFLPAMWSIEPTFTIGGYFEDEHFSQKSNFDGVIDRVNPSRNAQALYSQLLLAWQEQLFVTSGFRLDDGSTYGTHVNPRVSVAYIVPRLQTKLRGSYGEGLKAPTFVENFGTGSPFALGNPDPGRIFSLAYPHEAINM